MAYIGPMISSEESLESSFEMSASDMVEVAFSKSDHEERIYEINK